jgi:hypothetical protein
MGDVTLKAARNTIREQFQQVQLRVDRGVGGSSTGIPASASKGVGHRNGQRPT